MATEEKEKSGKPDTDLKEKVPAQTVESPIDRIEKEKIATGDNLEGKEKKDEGKKDDSKKEEPKDSKDASAKDEGKKDDSKKEEPKDSKDTSAKDEKKKDEEKDKKEEGSKEEKPGDKKDGDAKKTESKDEKASDKKENGDKKEDKKSKKAKTQPGTPAPPYGITHSELIRLQVKKKKTINFIIIAFFSLLAVVIFIAIVSVKYLMNRQKSNKRAVENIAITKVVQESPLKSNFQAMSEKINKDAASKNDIDANIAILQEFVDKYSSSYPQDEWVEQAKTQIKAQEELKMMY